jgi:hypothetical protein
MAKKRPDPMLVTHPDLPFDQPAEEKTPAQQTVDTNATVETLKAQIAQMQSELAISNREKLALMTQAPTVQPQMRPTDVDLKGLPDPVTDPEKYAQEIAARTRQALANEQHNAQQIKAAEGSQADKLNALWADFKEANPGYADESKVRYIAQELAQKAQARGRDVQKYMFLTADTFFGDVTKLYDKTFGKPAGGVEAEPSDEDGSLLDDEAEVRTQGIPGGGPSGKSAAAVDEDKAAQGKSMFDGLKSWQLKNGFTI